jgi:hypothetical protein
MDRHGMMFAPDRREYIPRETIAASPLSKDEDPETIVISELTETEKDFSNEPIFNPNGV